MQSQRGAALVEVLLAMTVPALVGGAVRAPRVPATGHLDVDQIIAQAVAPRPGCTIAAITPGSQPLAVYASAFSFSFVTECVATDSKDRTASSPYADAGPMAVQTVAWDGPSSDFPSSDDAMEAATVDTITFFFKPDNATARTDDFMLMRQLNSQQPEVVVRNVLTYPGRSFFQYYYRTPVDEGRQSTLPVPGSWLPLWHLRVEHGAVSDTGTAARIDTLRALEVNYSVTNGKTGADERIRQVSNVIPLSSLTPKYTRPCGYDPLFSQAAYAPRSVEAANDDLEQLLLGGTSVEGRGSSRSCSAM